MSDPKAKIQRLLDLINSAAKTAMEEYEKTPQGIPSTDLLVPHELDSSVNAVELKRSIRVLEGACETLCTTLAQPMHTLVNRAMPFEASCQRIAVTYRIADALVPFPNGLHITELAKITGLGEKKLGHVLRLLATRNCFREVSQDVFTNNRLSLTLVSSNPVSDLIGTFSEECTNGVSALHDIISHPEFSSSLAENRSSFMYSLRDEIPNGTFWTYMKNNPQKAQRFSRGMIGWSALTASHAIVDKFPWHQYRTVCDLGSGLGHLSMALVKAHPHLKVVLQDLPGPMQAAKQLWSREFPNGGRDVQVKFVPLDFTKEPPVPGLDVYYLKHIIHNWPDSASIDILRQIRSVMPKNGRVLIHEFVTQSPSQHAFERNVGLEKAPAPLLPNFGTGQIRTYAQDISMMSLFNSSQRNLDEFRHLGKESGLELIKAWDLGETAVLEYRAY